MNLQSQLFFLMKQTCEKCGEEVCLFTQFEADVSNLQGWQARVAALATNRERRKMAFRTYFQWSRGLGGGREKLEKCVEIGVRSWFPSRAYMGFREGNDAAARIQAIDMFGKPVDCWWVCKDSAWVLDNE